MSAQRYHVTKVKQLARTWKRKQTAGRND